MSAETLYKFLGEEGEAFHGGRGTWPLPTADGPGAWLRVEGDLKPCENGLHVCREQDLIHWLAPALYEAEVRGDRIDVDGDRSKAVVREARLLRRMEAWNDRTMRLFACDCARHVLRLYEHAMPGDTRVRDAIAVARRFAHGHATTMALDAARVSAWDAARDGNAATTAAWNAATAAAWAAAGDAATAGDAASDAAWDAAWSAASDAAWSAAGARAGDAAGKAAGKAERAWQNERLMPYIRGEASIRGDSQW